MSSPDPDDLTAADLDPVAGRYRPHSVLIIPGENPWHHQQRNNLAALKQRRSSLQAEIASRSGPIRPYAPVGFVDRLKGELAVVEQRIAQATRAVEGGPVREWATAVPAADGADRVLREPLLDLWCQEPQCGVDGFVRRPSDLPQPVVQERWLAGAAGMDGALAKQLASIVHTATTSGVFQRMRQDIAGGWVTWTVQPPGRGAHATTLITAALHKDVPGASGAQVTPTTPAVSRTPAVCLERATHVPLSGVCAMVLAVAGSIGVGVCGWMWSSLHMMTGAWLVALLVVVGGVALLRPHRPADVWEPVTLDPWPDETATGGSVSSAGERELVALLVGLRARTVGGRLEQRAVRLLERWEAGVLDADVATLDQVLALGALQQMITAATGTSLSIDVEATVTSLLEAADEAGEVWALIPAEVERRMPGLLAQRDAEDKAAEEGAALVAQITAAAQERADSDAALDATMRQVLAEELVQQATANLRVATGNIARG